MRKTIRATGVALLCALISIPAMAKMREVSLEHRVDHAGMIVEGQVLSSTPFYNTDKTMIYTSHQVEVYKIFKGGRKQGPPPGIIEIITPGGRLGNELHVVRPSLHLEPGASGLFFVEERTGYAGRQTALLPYAGKQGLVRYRGANGKAVDPFAEYTDIPALHELIQQQTGRQLRTVRPGSPVVAGGSTGSNSITLDSPGTTSGSNNIIGGSGMTGGSHSTTGGGAQSSHAITGFAPTTAPGGIQTVLTISGSGFGTLTGPANVFFDDADDGPGNNFGAVELFQILSWTDTEIQVFVANDLANGGTAGTGPVAVRDSAGGVEFSAGILTVPYSVSEIAYTPDAAVYRVSQENENQRGGYTYSFSTTSASNGVDFTSIQDAVDRFQEALGLWNCAAGWNVDAQGTTTVAATANDGINIVAFDNDADPLPVGVLGAASSFLNSCGGDTWFVNGIDIRFSRDGTGTTDWYYGANPAGQGAGEDDFMSVALHEVGHHVQQGHVNDPTDVMFPAIANGTNNRVLGTNNIDGGNSLMTQSAGYASCGLSGMFAVDCLAAPTANFGADNLGACGTSLPVQFTDLSANLPTAWSWDFGDGSSAATDRHPSHTYNGTGFYPVTLTATNANGSDVLLRREYILLTSSPVAASCNPGSAGHNDCCDVGIGNVSLNAINNTTLKDGVPVYTDFTCSQFTTVEPGSSPAVSVATGLANAEDVVVYVDWNNDGTLVSGETAFISLDTLTNHAGTITVPAGAVEDTALRMRVLSDFFPNGISSACENLENGQAEDYSIIVRAPQLPGAIADGTLAVTPNTSTAGDLDFSWGASCSTASDYSLHEGEIGNWYSHTSVACSTSGATSLTGHTPASGNRYFLVVPITAADEGSYGTSLISMSASERPVSTATCRAVQDVTACP